MVQINLVAAQLMLDREHSNRLVFEGKEGLDPLVDLSLRGAQIRAVIQGRASTWHRHLVLMPITAPAGETVRTRPCPPAPMGRNMHVSVTVRRPCALAT